MLKLLGVTMVSLGLLLTFHEKNSIPCSGDERSEWVKLQTIIGINKQIT